MAPGLAPLPPDSLALLGRLRARRVEHVLIGELAAGVHGSPASDSTVTIVPARFARNLERLASTLADVRAVPVDPSDQETELSSASLLRLGRWSLTTELADMEIDFEPPATVGYLDLFANSHRLRLAAGVEVDVAALEDLIRIAELRAAPTDVIALPALRAAVARQRSGWRAAASRAGD